MKHKANILLVEDDKNLGFIIKDFLIESGFEVDHAENGVIATTKFDKGIFDICLIDIMLPLKDGFSVAKDIKEKNPMIPIIFLTAKAMKEDKIAGFKLGADDYITKPFSTDELLLRVEAVLRRTQNQNANLFNKEEFNIGKFTFDFTNQTIFI